MRTHLLTIALSLCLPALEAGEASRRVLDLAAHYAVIVEGEVLRVEPQYSMTGAARYWTLLDLRARSYLRGGGPDTIRVQLRWINSDSIVTVSGHDNRALPVPQAGDVAILWIAVHDYDALPSSYYPQCEGAGSKPLFAELSSDLQIWPIMGDSLPALRCSLAEGLSAIGAAVDSASISTQINGATHVVLGRFQSTGPCGKSHDLCTTIRIAGILRGPALSDTLVSLRLALKLPRPCYKTNGLYPLVGPDSSGYFRPVHEDWPCFPVVDGEVMIEHRMIPGKPIDCLVPVRIPVEQIVETR